jgi:hypothetical protein
LRRWPRSAPALSALALALACGGGGGGDDDGAEITSANAQSLSGEVLLGMLWSAELGRIGGRIGGDTLNASASLQASGDGIGLLASFGPITEDCEAGGTVTFSGDVENPAVSTVGDRLDADFAQCEFEDGEVLDGFLSYVIDGLAGDLGTELYAFSVALTLEALELVPGDGSQLELDSLLFDGTTGLIVDTRDAPFSKSVVQGSALDLIGNGAGLGDGLELLLLGFTTNASDDIENPGGAYIFDGNGTLASESFSGELGYESEVPFESDGGGAPFEGELLITGAGGASIRLFAEGASVRLELDLDGDGSVDETQTTTWDALFP